MKCPKCECGKKWSIFAGHAVEMEDWKHEHLKEHGMLEDDDEI